MGGWVDGGLNEVDREKRDGLNEMKRWVGGWVV